MRKTSDGKERKEAKEIPVDNVGKARFDLRVLRSTRHSVWLAGGVKTRNALVFVAFAAPPTFRGFCPCLASKASNSSYRSSIIFLPLKEMNVGRDNKFRTHL